MSFEKPKTTIEPINKVCVVCNGCPENRLDVARAETYLSQNGWQIVKNWHEANLILFNACGRATETANHSLNVIQKIQTQKRENQQLIVWGCLPKIDPALLKSKFDGLVSFGSELVEVQKMLGFERSIEDYTANYLGSVWPMTKKTAPGFSRYQGSLLSRAFKNAAVRWDDYLDSRFNLVRAKDPSLYYIKISTGCRSNCAYCAVRKSRGLTKSKPIENIMKEFQTGLAAGFKEFSLMGTDLGSYGVDLGVNLIDLLNRMVSVEGDFTLSLRNVHPYHLGKMIDEFCEVLKSKKIQYLEAAAEAGSNQVLALMNRTYTIEQYKASIEAIRAAYPPIIIRTQLIAGFPGETEENFQQTLDLLDDVIFDYVEVYPFSARPGTAAETIEPKVPEDVKKQRFLKLYRKAILNRTGRKMKNLVLNRM